MEIRKLSKTYLIYFLFFLISCSEESNLEQTLSGNDRCVKGVMTFFIPNANPAKFGDLSTKRFITLKIPCSMPKVTQCQIRKELMRDNFMTEADAKRYLSPLCE